MVTSSSTLRPRQLAVAILTTALAAAAHAQAPNPYGIAGSGVRSLLGMPPDCLDYSWDSLRPGALIQMCRPNHYYNYLGLPVRWWGYNEATGQINDPLQLAQWIANNPGCIWIIGNEPDLNSQDGLTREQYADMYHTYYEFIHTRDATARFCIGAITGGSTADRLSYTTEWYEYVMNYYQATFGHPMPIDIWNIHSYCGPRQIEDPDQPIRDFITPFVNWCHTVQAGRFAGCEVWITELPIGEWIGALSEDWIIWYARRYLPRLERAGISRWFWFISQDSGEWATVALVKNGVSPLGQAYAALANGYPNEIIPVSPYVPEPTPAYYHEDFSAGTIAGPLMIKAGKWAVENGCLRQSRTTYPWLGESVVLQHYYADFDATFKARVNAANDPMNWAGFVFHASGRFDCHADSGYLVYLRRNGTIGLYNHIDGTMDERVSAVTDATTWQNIRVKMVGARIRVWANGIQIIDLIDGNKRFAGGYTTLQVYKTDSSYDDLNIWTTTNAVPEVTSGSVNRKWLVADGFSQYTASITANDADDLDQIVSVGATFVTSPLLYRNPRGNLIWGVTDEQIRMSGLDYTIMGDCVGGGRWAVRTFATGADACLIPISALTTTQGNQRTVTFAFAANPGWAPGYDEGLIGHARDVRGDSVTAVTAASYDVHISGPGDLDGDRDVDQSDFGLFQICFSGYGLPQSDPACRDALLDADDDVDSADVQVFQTCYQGPNTPADPYCGGM